MKFKPRQKVLYVDAEDRKRIAWLSLVEGQSVDEIARNLSRSKKDVRRVVDPDEPGSIHRSYRELKQLLDRDAHKNTWRLNELLSGDPLKSIVSTMSRDEAYDAIAWIKEWFDASEEEHVGDFRRQCHFDKLELLEEAPVKPEIIPEQSQDPFAAIFEIEP